MASRPPILAFQDDGALLAGGRNQGALLDSMRRMHGGRIRLNAIWGQVRKNGGYDFSALDNAVNAARQRGIGVQMTLLGTPTYLQDNHPGVDTALSARTPNAALMGQYARDVAQHFRGRVGTYSIWNEPNVGSFLAQDADHAAKTYRQLYQHGRGGVKAADPNARVLLGELTSQRPEKHGGITTLGFLRRVLAAGDHPLVTDGLALHPYQFSNPNRTFDNPDFGGISNLQAVQGALSHAFHSGQLRTAEGSKAPLYITEMGYQRKNMSTAQRAAYMGRAYELAQEAGAREFLAYQMLPSKPGDSWDTSIMNSPDQLGAIGAALARAARGR